LSKSERALENLALGLCSGILLALPFVVPALWWVHYVALIPWIVLLIRPESGLTWPYFLAGAYTFFVMGFGPLSVFHKALPFAVAALYTPLLLPFALVLRFVYLRHRWPLTLLVPVVWVATEWLRLHYSLGEVGLFPLGSSQFHRTTLIQIADLAGVYGISFVVALANGAIVDVWLAWRARRRDWRLAAPAGTFLVLLSVVLLYGKSRLDTLRIVPGPRLALIQPNAIHYQDPRRALETYEAELRFTRTAIAPGSADLIAWPENAIGEPVSDKPRYLEGLAELARYEGASLLVGGYAWADSSPIGGRIHTSAYYLSPQGAVVGRYDKIHMIPYSEYTPFTGWLARAGAALARTLLGYAGTGVPGTDVTGFPISAGSASAAPLQFSVPICFEVSSSGFARAAAARRADFLINITSEGLLGPPMYLHMLAQSTLRAVEHRMAVVRVANNALSGFIDPMGHARLMRSSAGAVLLREAGTLIEPVPVNATGSGTVYTRHGDVLAYLCAALSLALVVAGLARRRSSAASAPVTESVP